MSDQHRHTRTESFINTNIVVQVRMANNPCTFSITNITFICLSYALYFFMFLFFCVSSLLLYLHKISIILTKCHSHFAKPFEVIIIILPISGFYVGNNKLQILSKIIFKDITRKWKQ
jgi:hypothetical protein